MPERGAASGSGDKYLLRTDTGATHARRPVSLLAFTTIVIATIVPSLLLLLLLLLPPPPVLPALLLELLQLLDELHEGMSRYHLLTMVVDYTVPTICRRPPPRRLHIHIHLPSHLAKR